VLLDDEDDACGARSRFFPFRRRSLLLFFACRSVDDVDRKRVGARVREY
jgi:hypothetical protein